MTHPGDVGVLLPQGQIPDLTGGEPEDIGVFLQIVPDDVLRVLAAVAAGRQIPVELGHLPCRTGGRVQFEHALSPELLAQLPYASPLFGLRESGIAAHQRLLRGYGRRGGRCGRRAVGRRAARARLRGAGHKSDGQHNDYSNADSDTDAYAHAYTYTNADPDAVCSNSYV